MEASCLLLVLSFSSLLIFPPPLLSSLHCPFLSSDYQWRGKLGSRACCCDLDFKADTVPGADSQRALFLGRPGGATAGPFSLYLGVQVSVSVSACLLWGSFMLALLPGSLFVSQCLPPRESVFVLVLVGGWEWGLLVPCLLLCLSFSAYRPERKGNRGVNQPPSICHILSPLLGWFVGSLS